MPVVFFARKGGVGFLHAKAPRSKGSNLKWVFLILRDDFFASLSGKEPNAVYKPLIVIFRLLSICKH